MLLRQSKCCVGSRLNVASGGLINGLKERGNRFADENGEEIELIIY
jgi:hypothetical protein